MQASDTLPDCRGVTFRRESLVWSFPQSSNLLLHLCITFLPSLHRPIDLSFDDEAIQYLPIRINFPFNLVSIPTIIPTVIVLPIIGSLIPSISLTLPTEPFLRRRHTLQPNARQMKPLSRAIIIVTRHHLPVTDLIAITIFFFIFFPFSLSFFSTIDVSVKFWFGVVLRDVIV
jgi:hypothetical protein